MKAEEDVVVVMAAISVGFFFALSFPEVAADEEDENAVA